MHNPHIKSKSTETNQSSDKLLKMLEVMSTLSEPARLQEISRLCGMNASTALRFLTALQRRNYVAQHISTGCYYVTFKICALAHNVMAYSNIRHIALPFLQNVAHIFSESCNLSIENDMEIMYIEVANSPNKTLMSMQRIGNIAPMHCTGVGKLFLSEYNQTELEKVLAIKKMTKYTSNTLTTERDLKAELEKIRKAGYAFDNEECEVGARCIAAPIRDYSGNIIAGISVSGPSVRMTDEHIFEHLSFLINTANQISLRMGYNDELNFSI